MSSQLDLWCFIWGDGSKGGYIAGLDREERDLALAQVGEHRADVMTFAGLFWAAVASQGLTKAARTRLRDAARHLAVVPELGLASPLTQAVFEEIGPELPSQIEPGHALLRLAEETSEAELLEALAATVAPDARSHMDQAVVMRSGRQERVQLVVLEAEVDLDAALAQRALEEWVKLDPTRAYYRSCTIPRGDCRVLHAVPAT